MEALIGIWILSFSVISVDLCALGTKMVLVPYGTESVLSLNKEAFLLVQQEYMS